MSRQSRKGSAWENAVESYLQDFFNDPSIHVERLHGTNDEGDIHGLPDTIIECKNCHEYRVADWVAEAEAEAVNAGERYGAVFFKRHGRGLSNVGQHYALQSIDSFCRMFRDGTDRWEKAELRSLVADLWAELNAEVGNAHRRMALLERIKGLGIEL